MKISTVTEEEYKKLRDMVDVAHGILRTLAPDVYEKGGVVPPEVVNHPEYKMVTNEIRGMVEQYELYHNTPESFVAYIGKPKQNGMGVDRVVGQSYPVTVWTGLPIGNATKGSTWRVRSVYGTHMSQFYARVNGREFTGRGFGEGMSIVFRETAESKRKRQV